MRIGLIGCGEWGRHILRDLVSLGCEVTVVARSEESQARARAGGAQRIVPDATELPDVDGVVVATPTSAHVASIDKVLDRGVPVFVEKPLCTDPAAAARIARAAPGRVFVMDKWRYHPGVEQLAAIARDGRLGPVSGLRTWRMQWGNRHRDVDTLWMCAPHDLSIALEVLGVLPALRAAAGETSAEGCVSAIAVYGPRPWFCLEVSSRSPEWRREVRLHCAEGVAVLRDPYSPEVDIVRPDGPGGVGRVEERLAISREMPLLRQLRVFVEHLRGGPPPRSSVDDAAAIVRAIAALRCAILDPEAASGGGP